jgi:hypothetical protein
MYNIFYSPLFEEITADEDTDTETNIAPSSSDVDNSESNPTADNSISDTTVDNDHSQDTTTSNPEMSNPGQDISNPPPQEDVITKFQKYLLFLKLKDLQYKSSIANVNNEEFKELVVLLNMILEFFSIFKYDQIFTLAELLIEKFSKIKMEKIKK